MKTLNAGRKLWEILSVTRDSGLPVAEAVLLLLAAAHLKQLSDDASAGVPGVQVLEVARWDNLRRQSGRMGEAFEEAIRALSETDPTLGRSLEAVRLDEHAFGGSQQRERVLSSLVFELTDLNLKTGEPVDNPPGTLAEQLLDVAIGRMDLEQCHTTTSISGLQAALVAPAEDMCIIDPTCGFGGSLLASARYVKAHGGDPYRLLLAGQDLVVKTCALADLRLRLHGLKADIRPGDTLALPQHVEGGKLRVFDVAIGQPPLGSSRASELLEADPYARFRFGTPSRGKAELTFVQHFLATLSARGRACIAVAPGVLFRAGAEARIRANIAKADLLEAVVLLPAALLGGTRIPIALLVFNKDKKAERQDKVLFVNASSGFEAGRSSNRLRDSDVERVLQAYRNFADEAGYARVMTLAELAAQERSSYDLDPKLHVPAVEEADSPRARSFDELRQVLVEAEAKRNAAADAMDTCLNELGIL